MMTTRTLRHLVVRLAVLGAAAAIVFPSVPVSSAPTAVRVIRTFDWAEPSTDPTGLSYLPSRSALVVVDSEVDETPHYEGKNVWFSSKRGRVLRNFSTLAYSAEPTDVAVGSPKILYISDDNLDRIFTVRKGPDNAFGTNDDVVSSFATRPFGSADPAGLGFGLRSLWVTDGDNLVSDERVYRIRRGPNGVFDGVSPEGDDVVTSFSTRPLGLRQPSDVAYDAATGHLFLVSTNDDVIVETTVKGALVESYDYSGTRLKYAAGVVVAPASNDPDVNHVYVADRGLDNDGFPNENDGRIFEFALAP